MDGKLTDGPYYSPGAYGGYVDFEFKSGAGLHQVVSTNEDIVKARSSLSGKMRVFGSLTSKDGDSVILAKRIEFR